MIKKIRDVGSNKAWSTRYSCKQNKPGKKPIENGCENKCSRLLLRNHLKCPVKRFQFFTGKQKNLHEDFSVSIFFHVQVISIQTHGQNMMGLYHWVVVIRQTFFNGDPHTKKIVRKALIGKSTYKNLSSRFNIWLLYSFGRLHLKSCR